jgi:hypothetical protein
MRYNKEEKKQLTMSKKYIMMGTEKNEHPFVDKERGLTDGSGR